MRRQTTTVAERQPVEGDSTLGKSEAVGLRIVRILEAAGAGRRLRDARRPTDDLAVMLIGSGTSTFAEFDLSLERLEAQGMIELDKEGFACLSERGRDWIYSLGGPVQRPDARSVPVPSVL